jgi:hypothetical protein
MIAVRGMRGLGSSGHAGPPQEGVNRDAHGLLVDGVNLTAVTDAGQQGDRKFSAEVFTEFPQSFEDARPQVFVAQEQRRG